MRSQHQVNGRRERLGILVILLTYGIAVLAALLPGRGPGAITGTVESASSAIATLVANLATALPLGYAFAAGMITAFNPCGFALLPTYLTLFLGTNQRAGRRGGIASRLRRAVGVSATVTSSFVLLFGVVGLLLGVLTSAILRYLPWAGLAVGALMVLVGGWMVTGRTLYTSLGEQMADRLGERVGRPSTRGYLAYGTAYGLASLSCTLPIFLTVVGSVFATSGALSAVLQFLLYALGLGLVITLLTLGVALFDYAAISRVRSVVRYLQPVSAALVLAAGGYLVYYWLTLGGLVTNA